jgi:hypothetical protein
MVQEIGGPRRSSSIDLPNGSTRGLTRLLADSKHHKSTGLCQSSFDAFCDRELRNLGPVTSYSLATFGLLKTVRSFGECLSVDIGCFGCSTAAVRGLRAGANLHVPATGSASGNRTSAISRLIRYELLRRRPTPSVYAPKPELDQLARRLSQDLCHLDLSTRLISLERSACRKDTDKAHRWAHRRPTSVHGIVVRK